MDPFSPIAASPMMGNNPPMMANMGQMPMAQPMPMMDPVLMQLMMGGKQPPLNPELVKPKKDRKGYLPLPPKDYMVAVALQDQDYYRELVSRFNNDLKLYRQKHRLNVPPLFDPLREVAFRAATISNIVNKLTNMASASDWQHVVPFKDETSKNNSQIVENWYDYCRQCEEEDYAIKGGDASLQWDEFWYFFQYGRAIVRILPDPADEKHPYNEDLLSPATCYPIYGDSKEGMVRLTRIYEAKVVDIVNTYGKWNQSRGRNLEAALKDAIGYDAENVGEFYFQSGRLVEYWDTWNRGVFWRDVEVLRDSHELGFVPFVQTIAKGEPRSVVTPEGFNDFQPDEFGNVPISMHSREDLTEKGVAVFHHIVNTHKITEILYTLLLSEAMKGPNPAMITYSAPQLMNIYTPPIDTGPGAQNQRILNQQKVEMVPTSPRPTDTSPVLNKVQSDTVEGSINPAMYGSMDGSNIAGFAVESLISAAKDTILPYLQAFERFQALKAKMRARLYLDKLAPAGITQSVAMEGKYGSSPSEDLTPEILQSTGTKVEVKMIGVSDSSLPMMSQVSAQNIKEGLWSRRHGMEKLGIKDPGKMLSDIIAERAIEHPQIMENYVIPQIFLRNGQQDMAYLWAMTVVMPKVMSTLSEVMGMMGPAGMPGAGGVPGMGTPPAPPGQVAAPTGPQPNGMSNPMMGREMGPPTGPQPGQGRQ